MQASDLQDLGQKNQYNYWADTERKKSQQSLKSFKPIQKHFYTNYKTNMMRDAHEVAKVVASEISLDKECGHNYACDCKKVDSPLHRLNMRNQWKSRLRMSKKQKKDMK